MMKISLYVVAAAMRCMMAARIAATMTEQRLPDGQDHGPAMKEQTVFITAIGGIW